MKRIGIDVGGTKTEIIILESAQNKFKIINRVRIPTERDQGYSSLLLRSSLAMAQLLKKSKLKASQIGFLGVGLPGTVNPTNQKMIFGNTLMLVDECFSKDIAKKVGIKCETMSENDANCFAFAEWYLGVGLDYEKEFKIKKGNQTIVGVILGTGCGGGAIINGRLFRGKNGGACEIGHTELYTNGLSCYCGRNGCAENYVSGPAIESHFMRRMNSQFKNPLSSTEIFKIYRNGDPIAASVVEQYQRDLAKFLGNLCNIFDPDYFVLGGGMSNPPEIYRQLRTLMQDHSFLNRSNHSVTDSRKRDFIPQIYKNKLGDSAGVIGAAFLDQS